MILITKMILFDSDLWAFCAFLVVLSAFSSRLSVYMRMLPRNFLKCRHYHRND